MILRAGRVACLAMLALMPYKAMAADNNWISLMDPKVVEAAKQEGRVTVYASNNQALIEAITRKFQDAFPGVEVNIVRAASATLVNRFMSEMDAGVHEADVLNTANSAVFGREDAWQTLDVKDVPTLKDWPQESVSKNHVSTTQGTFVLAYNTEAIPESDAPKTWEDVLKPEYAGKIAMTDPRSSNNYMNWLDLMAESYGEKYLVRLREQMPVLAEGGPQAAQQISAGAFAIAFPMSFSHAQPLIEKGAPIKVVYPNTNSNVPAIGPIFSWGLPAKSQHPNAGKVFLTWLLTDEGQMTECGGNSASVKLKNYKGCPVPFDNFRPGDRPISKERQSELLKMFNLQ